MTSLSSLLERLEGATGPSLDLNADILRFFGWTTNEGCVFNPDGDREFTIPLPVASLDAALGLVEWVLPGWSWSVSSPDSEPTSYAILAADHTVGGPEPWLIDRPTFDARAPTPALAVCIALVRAVMASDHLSNGDAA